MSPNDAVRKAVREYNADFTTRAWVAIAMGILTSLLVYAFIMIICFFFFCLSAAPWYLVGTAIFGVFFAVAWRAHRRGADPIEGIAPPDQDDLGAIKLATALTGVPVSPRHTVAGAAGLVMHGPASIIEGREMLRSCVPDDDATIGAAAAVLVRLLDANVPLAEIEPKAVALLLVRTGLAKPAGRGVVTALAATVKGREAAGRP